MSPGPAALLAVLAAIVVLLNAAPLARLARRIRGRPPPGPAPPGSASGP